MGDATGRVGPVGVTHWEASMDAIAIILGISWTAAGLLCAALAIPLVQGRIRPNALYGIRFARAFESDDAWFAINRFGGKRLLVWSVPMIATGVVCFFLPLQSNEGLAVALGFLPLAFVLIPMFQSWRFARRYPSKV